MAQTGYTPIQLYYSSTTTNVPLAANLAAGELAINTADGKLFYKDSGGTVQVLATKGAGTVGGSNTQVQYNSSGSLAGSANMTFNGTGLTSGYFIPSSSTVPTNGLYLPAANAVGISTNSTNAIYIDSSQNVGIGTSSPVQLLTVESTSNVRATIRNSTENTSYASSLDFATGSGSLASNNVVGRVIGLITQADPSTLQSALTFHTNSGDSVSEKMRIDSSGNVGIGTSSPAAPLDVQAASGVSMFRLTATTGTNSCYSRYSNTGGFLYLGRDNSTGTDFGTAYSAGIWSTGAYPMVFGTNGTEKARISSAGGFGVGTTADPGAGAIYATGNITAYYSDERLKNVSGKIENALDKVNSLSGVYYTNNEVANEHGYTSEETQVGVLAQQVKEVLPEIVKAAPFDLDENGNSKSGENYMTVQYERLVPLLIEAIKELNAKVEALEAK